MITRSNTQKKLLDLQFACVLQNWDLVRALVNDGAPIDKVFNGEFKYQGYTVFHVAAEFPNNSLSTAFLFHDEADVTIKNLSGKTALHIAFENLSYNDSGFQISSIDCSWVYYTKNLDRCNPKTPYGLSHFHIFCSLDWIFVFEQLKSLIKKVDINEAVSDKSLIWAGYTALHFAVIFHSPEVVQFLLRNGADMNIKNSAGQSSFELAIYFARDTRNIHEDVITERYQVTDIMLQETKNRKIPIYNYNILHTLCGTTNNVAFFDNVTLKPGMINCQVSRKAKLWPGWTPLHIAAHCSNFRALIWLLKNGADVTLIDGNLSTPMHLISYHTRFYDRDEVAHIKAGLTQLIDHGTDLEAENAFEQTALDKLLLFISEFIDSFDVFTYMSVLIEGEMQSELVSEVLEIIVKECQAKDIDTHGFSILHARCASKIDSLQLDDSQSKLDYNINQQVDSESPLWPGWTPLHVALYYKKKNMVTELLDLGASNSIKNDQGKTPLHIYYLHFRGFDDFDARLFNYETNPCDDNMVSHFHIACSYCPETLNVVKKYLMRGISPNLPCKAGSTYNGFDTGYNSPLMIAIANNCIELVRLLLAHGADIHQKVARGLSPLEWNIKIDGRITASAIKSYLSMNCFKNDRKNIHRLLVKNNIADSFPDSRYRYHESLPIIGAKVHKSFMVLGVPYSEDDLQVYRQILAHEKSLEKRFSGKKYATKCKKELKRLQDKGWRGLVGKNSLLMSRLIKNKEYRKNVDSDDFDARFPTYGWLIKYRFVEAEVREPFLLEAKACLPWLLKDICRIPNECGELILQYLDVDSITQLVKAVKGNKYKILK